MQSFSRVYGHRRRQVREKERLKHGQPWSPGLLILLWGKTNCGNMGDTVIQDQAVNVDKGEQETRRLECSGKPMN